MSCWHWHHHGGCWEPYVHPDWRDVEVMRRRRTVRDRRADLRDYLSTLEEELAQVRRELEDLTPVDDTID